MSAGAEDVRAIRREPPAFRRVAVVRAIDLSPHLRRITFGGPELEGLEVTQPAASVRLLLPSTGATELVMPRWSGNEFLLPDDLRPLIRTFTPRLLRTDPWELDLDIVLHGDEGASGWALSCGQGDPAAISGTGRGYDIDPTADPLHLFGDEAAIPAIGQLIEWSDVPIRAAIEVARPDARIDLPGIVSWHDLAPGDAPGTALVAAVASASIGERARVWAAGEAAAMHRIRTLLAERGIERRRATVRGYWKQGRAGPG
ncbi:MAG TPA: siderophore-interacting protein [Acidimicrobiia bacterium]|nr:siderophore-interacting protein [Acidimicrobiia bacterium]